MTGANRVGIFAIEQVASPNPEPAAKTHANAAAIGTKSEGYMPDSVVRQMLAADLQPVYEIAEQVLGRRVSNQTIRTWSSPGKGRRGAILPVVFGLGGTRMTTKARFLDFWEASEQHPLPDSSPREQAGIDDEQAAAVLRSLGVRPQA